MTFKDLHFQKEWNYNRECRKNELYKLVDDGKKMEVSIWRRLPKELEDG